MIKSGVRQWAVLTLGLSALSACSSKAGTGDEPSAGGANMSAAGHSSSSGGSSASTTSGGAGGTATGGQGSGTAGSGTAAGGATGTAGSGNGAAGSGGTAGNSGSAGSAGTAGSGGTTSTDFPGDTFLPRYGGPSYFAKWPNGPSSDPSFVFISVWLQTPSNASKYKKVGIDYFTGLWDGPTEDQLTTLAAAKMPTICDQSGVWSAHLKDKTIGGWLQPDEPDNAQAAPGGGYDPCIAPQVLIDAYTAMVKNDATRPVELGLGRGVADTQWVGRGTCTGNTAMYADYQKAADILAFDIYPVNEGVPLELVATGVENLRKWSGDKKPVLADIEASNFDDTTRPSPAQIRSEVWMAFVHGAAGIQYFCHRFTPTFSETDCLDDAPTAAAMTSINQQLTTLAPVLNSPTVSNGVTTQSSSASIPVDTLLKRQAGVTFLFATEMRAGNTTATFTLRDFPAQASAEVLGENRTIKITNGVFHDDFASYGVHLYKITY
jgi:hypothetical protein